MDQVDAVAQEVAPWLGAVARLERWFAERAVAPGGVAVTPRHRQIPDRLRASLQVLGRRGEAIPAQAKRQDRGPDKGPPRPEQIWNEAPRNGPSANELRMQRDTVLRLALWQLLIELRDQAQVERWSESPFVELQRRIAHGADKLPPGVAPSLSYASSPHAMAFFNDKLRSSLRELARRYAGAHAGFAALAELGPFEDSGVAVQLWSGAWTAAVAGVYLDYLQCHSNGDLNRALDALWGLGADTVRFRAPSELMVLPSRERSMHLDLWTDLVLAQVLSHHASRWERTAAGDRWHRVRIAMHDLGTRAYRTPSGAGVRTFVRGLGVEMIYQAVFIHCAGAALGRSLFAEMPANSTQPSPATQMIVVKVPVGCPGQEMNLELAVRWLRHDEGRRLFADALSTHAPLVMTEGQQRVIGDWSARRPVRESQARALNSSVVDWCPAALADCFEDESGTGWAALGHARLWAAAGEQAQWLDLVLTVWDNGRWHSLPLCVQDELIGGDLRSWLLVEVGTAVLPGINPGAVRAALQVQDANFWAVRAAGVGAFICCAVDLDRPANGTPQAAARD